MNLQEIVNRPDHLSVDEFEALFVIEEYIKDKKGIMINAHIDKRQGSIWMSHEYSLMFKFLSIAIIHFREKK